MEVKLYEKLYEYQQSAVRLLEETQENLLVIAPTGAGKTLVGFKAMQKAGRGAYIGPTRALMYEKFLELQGLANENGQSVRIGNKDYSLSINGFQESNFAVISPWKLEMLMASARDFSRTCPLVVIDEAHGLDPDTELIYTLLKVKYPAVRRVALSATIHEDDEAKFTAWLDAVLVKSEERPVPLIERVLHFDVDLDDEGQEFSRLTVLENGQSVDELTIPGSLDDFGRIAATLEYIRDQGDDAPVLIFTPSRNHSAFLARGFAKMVDREDWDPELTAVADGLPAEASDYTNALKFALKCRIGIHNGSLTQNERELVQTLATQGKLDIIVTCYTLGQGVNLPARHIVFASLHDYGDDGQKKLLDVSTFRQIEGRAGRPQFDSIGYCWIPVSSEIERVEVEEVLLKYKASKVESRIYNEYFLTAKLPMLVHLGFNAPEKLADFMGQTFWGQALQDLEPIIHQFEKIFNQLVERKVIGVRGQFVYLTPDGQRLARLGVHPDEFSVMQRLCRDRSLDYNEWVAGLAGACSDYVLGARDDEAINTLVESGLTVYTQRGMGLVRDLADYVSRLLDISRQYFKLEDADREFISNWQRQVRDKFVFGQLEVAEKLAGVIARDQVKRLVRNMGIVLADPENFIDDIKVQKGLARILWGSEREFGFNERSQAEKVATALGVETNEFRGIAHEQWQRVRLGLPLEDPQPKGDSGSDEEEEQSSYFNEPESEEMTEAELLEKEVLAEVYGEKY